MARASGSRITIPLRSLSTVPGIKVDPLPQWNPPKGLDYLSALTAVQSGFAPQITNLWLDRGTLRSRYGTSDVGTGIVSLMAVINFLDENEVGWLLRFTTTKMQRWDGSSWADVYTSFTGDSTNKFTFTAFNNRLIFSNGIDGTFEYNFSTGVVTKITGAPGCKFLTTFTGRVIASNVVVGGSFKGSRIQWCVKNNHLDWTGQGSGFEDLLSTPGGQIDQQRGVWPITDTIALAVRSRSIWQMTSTGDVDAPFRFDRLYDNLGTEYPYSLDGVPGAVCGLFNDNFYVVSHQEIKQIGDMVKDKVISETTTPVDSVGMFDSATKNYWFVNQTYVYRFSFQDQGWTRHQYPFTIKYITRTKSAASGKTIDQLTGTIDGLTGTIDGLVGATQPGGTFFASGGATGYVIKEDQTVTTDSDGAGATTNSSVEIQTAPLQYGSILNKKTILGVQFEYEAGASQTLTVASSIDLGQSWQTYSSLAAVTVTVPTLVPFRKTIEGKSVQMRLTSATLGRLRIVNFITFGQIGAPVYL